MKKKRLFIASFLSNEIISHIDAFQKKQYCLPVRWSKREHLHITLIPPFYHEHEQEVEDMLAQCSFSPFDLEFTDITFGPPSRPRMIWLHAKASEPFFSLCDQLNHILGLKQIKRQPIIHVTLARFSPTKLYTFPFKKLHEQVSWTHHLNRITLVESVLRQEGSLYTPIAHIDLIQ